MIDRIKSLCSQQHINFAQLERRLNFANGSLAKSKEDKIQAIRVKALADFFGVSMEYILCGTQTEKVNYTSEEKSIIAAYRRSDSLTRAMVIRNLGLEAAEKRDIV